MPRGRLLLRSGVLEPVHARYGLRRLVLCKACTAAPIGNTYQREAPPSRSAHPPPRLRLTHQGARQVRKCATDATLPPVDHTIVAELVSLGATATVARSPIARRERLPPRPSRSELRTPIRVLDGARNDRIWYKRAEAYVAAAGTVVGCDPGQCGRNLPICCEKGVCSR